MFEYVYYYPFKNNLYAITIHSSAVVSPAVGKGIGNLGCGSCLRRPSGGAGGGLLLAPLVEGTDIS